MKKIRIIKLLIAIFLFVSAGINVYLSFKFTLDPITGIAMMAGEILLGVLLLCMDSRKRMLHIISIALLLFAAIIEFYVLAKVVSSISGNGDRELEIIYYAEAFACAVYIAILVMLFVGLFKKSLTPIPVIALGSTFVGLWLFVTIYTIIEVSFAIDLVFIFLLEGLLAAGLTLYAVYNRLLAQVLPDLPPAIAINREVYRSHISLHDVELLKKIGELKDQALITDKEFAELKKEIITKSN